MVDKMTSLTSVTRKHVVQLMAIGSGGAGMREVKKVWMKRTATNNFGGFLRRSASASSSSPVLVEVEELEASTSVSSPLFSAGA